MLRLTPRLQQAALPGLLARNYSTGFELSKYLDRIQAISKTKVNTTRRPRGVTFQESKRNPSNAPSKISTGAANGDSQRTRSHSARSPRIPNNANETKTAKALKPGASSDTARANTNSRLTKRKPSISASQKSEYKSTESGWTSFNDSVSKPLSRSTRRTTHRKPPTWSSKPKISAAKKASPKPTNRHSSVTRDYKPFLTSQEALDIVMRNEGTSHGGFISPIDVSLTSLQKNFTDSAVSYDSRVLSLLNNVPPSVAQDRQQLEKLVKQYVSGNFEDHIVNASTMSSHNQGLAFAVGANQSISPQQKQFFAQVGAGKLTPKQISGSV